ncbi:MAG: MFS transporter [Deltaproteobacteria bacterium HGW-Deltaproteobacteria-21]|nr:MAG: MFS transporter [Deltaproteobacteria bacterium HGW-Deltaproteobacteria-21]
MEKDSVGFRSYLAPVLFLAAIFFQNFISRIILAPLLPSIEKDLALSHGQAGSFFFLMTAGYLVAMLGSGFFSARYTHRRTIVVAIATVGVALVLMALSGDLWGMRAALLLLGMCAGLYLPSGIATLTQLVDPKNWGKALAIHELGPNLGFVVAPLIASILLTWLSWRSILVVLGGMSLLLAMGFARFGRGGDFAGEAPSFTSFFVLIREPLFWAMMILFGLGVAGSLGIYAMLPLYLVFEHGADAEWANTLVALSRISGLGTAFVAGFATDRIGPKRTLFGILLLTGLITLLLGVSAGRWLILLVLLQPALSTSFFPPALAALSSSGLPVSRNVAVSFTIPLAFLFGGGIVPMFIGVMGDEGLFNLGVVTVGVLLLGGSLIALTLKGHGKR